LLKARERAQLINAFVSSCGAQFLGKEYSDGSKNTKNSAAAASKKMLQLTLQSKNLLLWLRLIKMFMSGGYSNLIYT